jgi:ribosomal protein S12 methylthiotransferase
MNPVTVYLHPVGCPKANADMEKIGWLLQAKGFGITPNPEGAAVGVVFGCGFIEDAKRESIDDILALAELKHEGRLKHLIVVGCLPQKYARSLCLSLPEVDSMVGNTRIGMLPGIIRDVCEGRAGAKTYLGGVFPVPDTFIRRLPAQTAPWTRTVMIGDGCDNACTYCSIPNMRGPLRSRSIPEILEEIDFVVDQGAREIVLAGQDTASYGKDRGRSRLGVVLEQVASRNPGVWIRLSYVNPDNLEDGVPLVFREHANICNYIDMPIQHASPRILKMMGRKDDPGLLRSKIGSLRNTVPDIALRTSVIVGFPGETEDDLEALLDFLREVEFDMAGVFGFSPQPGTPAEKLKHKVPEEVIQERVIDVVSLQDAISHRRMEALVGRELEVLVEEKVREGGVEGRSQYDMAEIDRTIRIPDSEAEPGSFITARIQSVSGPYEWTATCL